MRERAAQWARQARSVKPVNKHDIDSVLPSQIGRNIDDTHFSFLLQPFSYCLHLYFSFIHSQNFKQNTTTLGQFFTTLRISDSFDSIAFCPTNIGSRHECAQEISVRVRKEEKIMQFIIFIYIWNWSRLSQSIARAGWHNFIASVRIVKQRISSAFFHLLS